MNTQQIFLTGTSGLVGSHTLFKLAQKYSNIKVLVRNKQSISLVKKTFLYYHPSPENLLKNIQFVEGDILDMPFLLETLQGIHQVYHCAAWVSYKSSDRDKMMKINIEGTANMVNASLENGVKKFCHVSSIAALGNTEENRGINETDPWDKNYNPTNYSLSKYLSEMEVWRASEEGLKVIIVNPCIILGPGEWGRSSTTFFPMIDKGFKFYPTGGTSFVYVKDVADIMIQLMESPLQNERFIVASENLTFKSFFELMAKSLHKPAPHIKLTPFIGNIGWMVSAILNFFKDGLSPITRESVLRSRMENYYDNSKIKKALNYQFISIENSVQDTARIYISEMKKAKDL